MNEKAYLSPACMKWAATDVLPHAEPREDSEMRSGTERGFVSASSNRISGEGMSQESHIRAVLMIFSPIVQLF